MVAVEVRGMDNRAVEGELFCLEIASVGDDQPQSAFYGTTKAVSATVVGNGVSFALFLFA